MTNGPRQIPVYLGLGSNLGDREANLGDAVSRIRELGIEIARESSIYETEPVGRTDQRWFLNQVLEIRFSDELMSEYRQIRADANTIATIKAEALLSELLNIELAMGRERAGSSGPRVIDIDLLLFGDLIVAHSKDDEDWPFIDRNEVFVPHPRMHERRFVLEPLCEIAPDIVHPTLGLSCRRLLEGLQDRSEVRLYRQKQQ